MQEISIDVTSHTRYPPIKPQPVFALVSASLTASLESFLRSGERKIMHWYKQHTHVAVDFGDDYRPFMNVNTDAERQELEDALG